MRRKNVFGGRHVHVYLRPALKQRARAVISVPSVVPVRDFPPPSSFHSFTLALPLRWLDKSVARCAALHASVPGFIRVFVVFSFLLSLYSSSSDRIRPRFHARAHYVNAMRAARCLLLWAAVSVTGNKPNRTEPARGGGIGNGDGDGPAHRGGELAWPQRLQERADPEGGELAHGRLDTRAKTEDADAPHGGEHCYYHGTVRGVKGSWVALSTCHGLWGMFSDGNFSYEIEPLQHDDEQAQSAHVVYRLPDLQLNAPHCPECNATTDPDSAVDDAESDGPTFTHSLRRVKRQIRRPPRTVQTETKYIELLVVNDYDLFVQMRRSTTQTRNFAKSIVNMADAIYKEQLNTRLVLVAMETWSSQNMVSVGDDPLMTLRDFMKYRRENIKEKSDAAHLFSGRTFQSSRSGTAYIGGICSSTRGGGVNEYGNVGPMAITLCQSLGQNLGMMWNKDRATAGETPRRTLLYTHMFHTAHSVPRDTARHTHVSEDTYTSHLSKICPTCPPYVITISSASSCMTLLLYSPLFDLHTTFTIIWLNVFIRNGTTLYRK
ncbi:hypothetical protein HF521_020185 [Silurus meridionalis]|uniref:Peptidase M12B domain-containing protein n=1 Tax=Silurus meridionalis TaxID=175797 RepID=A0A8T0BD69_SILME|nr:hypothetical protein HF521_020185 [Silurus meridionalis]